MRAHQENAFDVRLISRPFRQSIESCTDLIWLRHFGFLPPRLIQIESKLTSLKTCHTSYAMRTSRQLVFHSFEKLKIRDFGGSLLKGNPREQRPISVRRPMH